MKIKLDDKGRLMIPKIIRESLGLKPNGEVKLDLVDEKLIIKNAKEEK